MAQKSGAVRSWKYGFESEGALSLEQATIGGNLEYASGHFILH